MIPKTLTLTGIGPFREETVLDWTAQQSPVAICAPYGTGKTWLLEGLLLALYGRGAWYSGPAHGALSRGGDGEGRIDLRFEHAGETYEISRVLRVAGKSKIHRAILSKLFKDGAREDLAGPKVGDVDRAIEALIGDYETALGTWFLAQNRRLDLCGQPGDPDLMDRRRRAFHAMIGAAHLDADEKRFADAGNRSETVAEELEVQIAAADGLDETLVAHREGFTAAGAELEAARARALEANEDLSKARAALAALDGDDAPLVAAIQAADGARAILAALREREEELRPRLAAAEKLAETVPARERDVAHRAALQRDLAVERGAREAWLAIQEWKREGERLRREEESLTREIASLEAVPGGDAETIALAARLPELRDAYRVANATTPTIREANRRREATLKSAEARLAGARASLASYEARRAKAPATPGDPAVCEACPLLSEWRALDEKITRARETIARAEAEIAALPPAQELPNLEALEADGKRAADADRAVKASEAARERLTVARAAAAELPAKLAANAASEPQEKPSHDPACEIEELSAAIEILSGAEERLVAARTGAVELDVLRAEWIAWGLKIAGETSRSAPLLAAEAQARAALADREAARTRAQAGVATQEGLVRQAQESADTALAAQQRLLARIEEGERRLAEREAMRDRALALRDDAAGYRDLRTCFGPRGARQILMDAAAPRLEALADDLFDAATGGRQRLRISTQRPLADGSLAEDFSILVRDQWGEADVLEHSGGELQLILILFRVATAVWNGELRGEAPDCLFLDEAFDRLGAEGTEDLLRAVEHVSDKFRLIALVTHDPAIAARMRSRIDLSARDGRLVVETQGGNRQ